MRTLWHMQFSCWSFHHCSPNLKLAIFITNNWWPTNAANTKNTILLIKHNIILNNYFSTDLHPSHWHILDKHNYHIMYSSLLTISRVIVFATNLNKWLLTNLTAKIHQRQQKVRNHENGFWFKLCLKCPRLRCQSQASPVFISRSFTFQRSHNSTNEKNSLVPSAEITLR